MSQRLEGTVALVTGASSGIGEATAVALAREGASVAIAARRRDRLDALAAQIGNGVVVIEGDLSRQDQAEAAVEETVAKLGSLDILVNNAGVMLLGPAETASLEEWQQMVQINLLGLMYCTHAALPHLLKAAAGSRGVSDLVNISSTAGRVARNGSSGYNATKFGVVAFTESLRQEFAAKHLRASVVEPGAVDTELRLHNRPEILEEISKRFGGIARLDSEDIADTITYIVTRPAHVAINELLVRPTEQAY